jgi:cyclic beta-1,2-glucan synthetase
VTLAAFSDRLRRRLRAMISPTADASENLLAGPIHGELLGTDRLAERAQDVARAQRLRVTPRRDTTRTPLLSRLDATAKILASIHARLESANGRMGDVDPAGEWLLDNAYVIDEHIRQIRESLPRTYYRELPELDSGHLAGYPRVYEIATTLIGHSEGRVDRANTDLFVSAFQKVQPLRIGELWAIPAMLRLALIENVRRMALRTEQRLEQIELADAWAARVATGAEALAATPAALNDFLAEHPPLTPVFVSRFLRQVRHADVPPASLVWLEPWLAEAGVDADDAATRANERLALTQVITANSISSLRAIAHLDWKTFVEEQSRLDAVLRDDPSGVYSQMTFATRDAYRHTVERLARSGRYDEQQVARFAVELAAAAASGDPEQIVKRHVGYYLVDDGLAALRAKVGYRRSVGESVHEWVVDHPNLVFIGGVGAGTASAMAAALWLASDSVWMHWPLRIALLLLTILPASEIAVGLVNQLITAFLSPRILPKLDMTGEAGIPSEFRTVVVIPTLFGDEDDVQDALETIEVQFLANREAHLHFALLSDFTDADCETRAGDDAIVAAAIEGIRALNTRYANGVADQFFLFHRARQWNPQERVWMGWERKRGKLAQFNQYVRGGPREPFAVIVGDSSILQQVRYAITLDADTILPPAAAPLLVGTLAHPLNRAVYDAARSRVRRGYGVLQPRVGVSLPSAYRSRFATIHSGHPGVDPYTTAVSDVYQDLFGEGSFTGKGIYDIDVFERATHGRFPENMLLSHDLIEGNYARAGLTTDIEVFDDYPTSYLAHARRKHRWIRGDWQLLPWIGRRVPGPHGQEQNRLSLLSRWKIVDNLRRSVLELAQLAFVLAGWTILPGSPLRWTLLLVAAVAAPWIITLLLAVLRPPTDKSWRAYYGAVGQDAWTSSRHVLLTLAFLPHQASVSADAVVRTLWRMLFSRRHLLQWQTARQAERSVTSSAAGPWSSLWRAMWPAVLAGVTGLVIVAVRIPSDHEPVPLALLLAIMPLSLVWITSPWLASVLSRRTTTRMPRLSSRQRMTLMRYARTHWQYFERFVTAETHWLTPDNFQEDPEPTVAMRTSPTNIGLQLLATVSAFDLGFITIERMLERLERAVATMARLRRHRGHLYNWYDLHDLEVLEPAYVSTVDSGNLAGHLIALRQSLLALAELEAPGPEQRTRLRTLADQVEEFEAAMDFHFLFDAQRELFAIGYQEGSATRDASSYDLLASEARLTSFIAVARNQVPLDHWFRLGRSLTRTAGDTALVSWSGSMFEYLMPSLVMRTYPHTLLDQSSRGAVRRQILYGTQRGVPWGVSESAYNVRDRQLTYQYRAFGVPDLGLKRGLGRDLVIAPYASALAAILVPSESLDNLDALESRGALGPYGFYDALDFTRPLPTEPFAIVRNYMAHHVGMSLVAFTNALHGNVWQQRFHADAGVRAAEPLLHERIPRRLVFQSTQRADVGDARPAPERERPAVREFETADTPQPRVALLGHLPYTVMVDNRGAGYSHHEELAVTRWRADATTDSMGQFCYVKDLSTGRRWSVAHQPVCAPADSYRACLATDRVTFQRADGDISTRTEICVVPGDAAEVRRVTVTNHGRREVEIELTSYAEVVLATPESDRAHPAFGNLFVETEWHAWCSALIATRRPRSAKEAPVWGVHVAAADDTQVGPISYETDRWHFIGRGRSTRDPAALDDATDGPLAGHTGAVLDPIFAVRVRLRLAPGTSGCVSFTTIVAASRERAFALADRYDDIAAAQRALDLAWTTAQVELRELDIAPADAGVYQDIAGHLLYADRALGAPPGEQYDQFGSQPLLWSVGISGDRPILLATVASVEGLTTLRQLLSAHRYWRRRALEVDLVLLNVHPPSYRQDLHDRILTVVRSSTEGLVLDQPGGVHVKRAELLLPETLLMLRASARVHVPCDGRSLSRIMERLATDDTITLGEPVARFRGATRRRDRETPAVVRVIRRVTAGWRDRESAADRRPSEPRGRPEPTVPVGSLPLAPGPEAAPHASDGTEVGGVKLPAPARLLDNGLGGLTTDNTYEIRLQGDMLPPAPWANVIANSRGGFLVTEQGGGFSWVANSHFYRLTPWYNDPVGDPVSDVLYLRDDESGDVWTPTPAPIRHDTPYIVRHGAGVTCFEHEHGGIASTLTLGMAPNDPVKLSLLRLTNQGARPRRLTIAAYVEWTLGVTRENTRRHVHTAFMGDLRAILARNSFDAQFATQLAFCSISEPLSGHTADRREFLGPNGATVAPVGLRRTTTLSGRTGSGMDPCALLQSTIELLPFETRELCVVLGAGEGADEVRQFIEQYGHVAGARAALTRSTNAWRERLSVVQVHTPAPAFDAMVNQWALYQALACRMWARSALYQSSGAFGFRDQLQDCMALVYADPPLARAHILTAAARQFVEGDVQHWWHPQSGRGVRTRFSDDLAWLPYVVDHYVTVTGDRSVLDAYVPFLSTHPLEPHEHERYDLPSVTDEHGSIYEHCLRALRRACTTGTHGLPLIGSGDWNDGMSRVGIEGRGESVWLGWFLVRTLRSFAPYAAARGDVERAAEFRAQADAYVAAIEEHGWDGAWYRRAFYDDGTPLGSHLSDECRIDAIAQSWSVIAGAGDPERQTKAMDAFEQQLVRHDARLLLLLTPPFDRGTHDPGYIKGYLPGVRENGAQYTHAALWSVLAMAMRGEGDRAFALFDMLNPLTHTATPEGVAIYRVEPYVIAADVYTAAGQLGRGGWTWYTGSASWFYRVALEAILGIRKCGDRLTIAPCVPSSWPGYRVSYRVGRATYEIDVRLPPIADVTSVEWQVTMDGAHMEDGSIPLVDDGATHHVLVVRRPRRRSF